MNPNAYAAQASSNFQNLFSNVLMGLREGRAQRDESLRSKAFEQEQELKKLQIEKYLDDKSLEDASALGSGAYMKQIEALQNMGSSDRVDEVRNSAYQPVDLSGYSDRVKNRVNAVNNENFNIQKQNILSKSIGQQNRLKQINSLSEFSGTLSADPVKQALVDETRALLQAGGLVSQMSPESRSLLNEAGRYQTERALASDPKYRVEMMKASVEMDEKKEKQLQFTFDSIYKDYEQEQKNLAAATTYGDSEKIATARAATEQAYEKVVRARSALTDYYSGIGNRSDAFRLGMSGTESSKVTVNYGGQLKEVVVTPDQLRELKQFPGAAIIKIEAISDKTPPNQTTNR